MNDINAVLAGRVEDKWVEFVVSEFAAEHGDGVRRTPRRRERGIGRRVEVRASYVWLLACAVLVWIVR